MTNGPTPKILVLAFACLPNKGSEPGVGWETSQLIASWCNVVVLTRTAYRSRIEQSHHSPTITFAYYDIPFLGKLCQKLPKLGGYFYYHLWQWRVIRVAKKLHRHHHFDLVHHITFATLIGPSYIWRLGLPFIFGPAGGGEKTPKPILTYPLFGLKSYLWEGLRLLRIYSIRINPLHRQLLKKARQIIVVTRDSLSIIPKSYQKKTKILPAISFKRPIDLSEVERDPNHLLFVSRFLKWKGIRLFLDIAASLHNKDSKYHFTMVGTQDEKRFITRYLHKAGLEQTVTILQPQPQVQIFNLMRHSKCLVFTSFHDSGGCVLLEAIAQNCPVICLDTGGPGEIVTQAGISKKISPYDPYPEIIRNYVTAIESLPENPDLNPKQEIHPDYFIESKRRQLQSIYQDILSKENALNKN